MEGIHWLHHSSFRIETEGKIIYFDPWKIKNKIKADYIFISHEHYDHMSVFDVETLIKDDTIIICPVMGTEEIKGKSVRKLKPGEKYKDGLIIVEVVPAYNMDKSFHSKSSMKNGYVLEIGGKRIYHAGDTDLIPEMKILTNINVALLPVGGTYTMNAKEAAMAVETFNPEISVPMHWGTIVGKESDAFEFKKLAKGKVEILKEEEPL